MNAHKIQNICGKDINLVEISPAFFDIIIEWRNDPDIQKYFFTRDAFTYEQQVRWYARYVQDETDMTFMIVAKTGIALGMVGLYNIDMQGRTAEFGRLLIGAKKYRGFRFGKEACSMLLKLAFETLNLKQVYLSVHDWNVKAVGLYDALGFRIEKKMTLSEENGIKRSTYKMVLHSTKWQASAATGRVGG
jgi:RimJ/RimL family protein N-acetyltransferase